MKAVSLINDLAELIFKRNQNSGCSFMSSPDLELELELYLELKLELDLYPVPPTARFSAIPLEYSNQSGFL